MKPLTTFRELALKGIEETERERKARGAPTDDLEQLKQKWGLLETTETGERKK